MRLERKIIMIIKRKWMKLDEETGLYVNWSGWYLFGFIPLYLTQGDAVKLNFK